MTEPPDAAAVTLLHLLRDRGYDFVTVTPLTHDRILARRGGAPADNLRDALGWSLPFAEGVIAPEIMQALQAAGFVEDILPLHQAKVRVSSVRDRLFLHSRHPTEEDDAVFLGPDSYRFANLIEDELTRSPLRTGARIVDIGTGAGVGVIVAGDLAADAELWATDVNSRALRLARVNAAAAGKTVQFRQTSALDGVEGSFDLALLNPPYMVDDRGRAYRDGGAMHGGRLSLDLATDVLPRLRVEGRLVLYTGSAIVDGVDELRARLADLAAREGCELTYREIDPDVFGEELVQRRYAAVDRIAVVSAVFTRTRPVGDERG